MKIAIYYVGAQNIITGRYVSPSERSVYLAAEIEVVG